MLSVRNKPFMLCIVMMNVVMLSVVAPFTVGCEENKTRFIVRKFVVYFRFQQLVDFDLNHKKIEKLTKKIGSHKRLQCHR